MNRKPITKMIMTIAFVVVVVVCTTAFSHFQVRLFDAAISFNGIVKEIADEYRLFNYEDRSYVPVRFITENMGAAVHYDDETKAISLYYLEERPLKSKSLTLLLQMMDKPYFFIPIAIQ